MEQKKEISTLMRTGRQPMDVTLPSKDDLELAESRFAALCTDAQGLQLVNNTGAAFRAATLLTSLRAVLSDGIMNAVFMPLMNTRIGFLTDRDPNKRSSKTGQSPQPYPLDVVRDAIIDAIGYGLLPTGNQFNIISERMYPTKEGFTALLRKTGCKYFIQYSTPKVNEATADVTCRIDYEWNGEKKSFNYVANVKRDGYSSLDQIKGKAERKAKKVLYEYITGIDFGDADEQSSEPCDGPATEGKESAVFEKKEELRRSRQALFNETDDLP